MTRTTSIRFGTFGQNLGTPVHSDGWWFCVCADVELQGTPEAFEWFSEHVLDSAPTALLALLQNGREACWIRAGLPIGLQCNLEASYTADALFRIGLVGVRVEPGWVDVTYPFLCTDQGGRAVLWFSDRGPDRDTRRQIARAFWSRLLDDGRFLTDFEALVIEPATGERSIYSCHGGKFSYESDGA